MKKILLALLLALPCFGMAQVATQKVSNTAVIYDSRSPVTFGTNFTGLGANYLLNNQTLTGNGSILTRSLGDARYASISSGGGDVFTASNNVLYGSNTLSNNTLFLNTITFTNNQPIISIYSTNANQAVGGGSLARIEFYVPGFSTGSIFGSAGSTNATITGSIPGDTTIRANSGGRFIFGNGSAEIAYWDLNPATKQLVFFSNTQVTLSNNLNVASGSYQVGGVSGISRVITNTIGSITNIEFFASGILTNLIRTP